MPLPKPQSPPKKPASQARPVSPSAKKNLFFKKFLKKLENFGTVPLSEKLFFAENLRVMIKAGLSMSEALETLSMQTKNKKFRNTLLAIKKGVMEGHSLASMLAKYPKIYPAYFVNMIRVGEKSGNLEQNLEQLSIQMKKDHDIRSKVRGAMIYPSVILAATVGIVILMFVYVIPNVLSIFEEMTLELPLATKILIVISKAVTNYGVFVAVGAVIFFGTLITLSRTKKGKRVVHWIILHLWIIGPIAKKINLARFARTLSSLLKTDIPVIESFKITSSVLGNVYYKNACWAVSLELAKGTAINSVLKRTPQLFPPLVTQMTSVGEKSGTLDELLSELAVFYETEVTEITKNMSSIIEPILIVFLGSVVGLIAFAVISPIYTLSEGMGQ
ncbi:type II secretion system F family protein [Patescibacteria group bacterium]|nr:type II secretion system F family protein [Patescibacteria group bacterium]